MLKKREKENIQSGENISDNQHKTGDPCLYKEKVVNS